MKTKKIQIDNNQCSKCGKCVKACLKNVLSQESKKADIKIGNTTQCDLCGTCIKVCRRKALTIEGISFCRETFSEQVKRKGLAFSLMLFPIMLLVGFLMHPHDIYSTRFSGTLSQQFLLSYRAFDCHVFSSLYNSFNDRHHERIAILWKELGILGLYHWRIWSIYFRIYSACRKTVLSYDFSFRRTKQKSIKY